jgi:hypothetical protein
LSVPSNFRGEKKEYFDLGFRNAITWVGTFLTEKNFIELEDYLETYLKERK